MAAIDFTEYFNFYPDFPKKGIVFIDILPIMSNRKAFKEVVDELASCVTAKTVLAPEARAFLFASPLLACPGSEVSNVIAVRKSGKLPHKEGDLIEVEIEKEYGKDRLFYRPSDLQKSMVTRAEGWSGREAAALAGAAGAVAGAEALAEAAGAAVGFEPLGVTSGAAAVVTDDCVEVTILDDILATGGTALGLANSLHGEKVTIDGCEYPVRIKEFVFLVEITGLPGREVLEKIAPVKALLQLSE